MNRSRLRVLAAFALAASVVSWAGGPAVASTKEDRARARLSALVQRIGSEQDALDAVRTRLDADASSLRAVQARLDALGPQLGVASDGFAQVEDHLMRARDGLASARSAYDDAQG